LSKYIDESKIEELNSDEESGSQQSIEHHLNPRSRRSRLNKDNFTSRCSGFSVYHVKDKDDTSLFENDFEKFKES